MTITKDQSMFEIVIRDEDRVQWKNGVECLFKLKKDDRPDWNVYEYFDDYDTAIGKLYDLGLGFGMNKTPKEVEEAIRMADEFSKLYKAYLKHVLALCLEHHHPYLQTPNSHD